MDASSAPQVPGLVELGAMVAALALPRALERAGVRRGLPFVALAAAGLVGALAGSFAWGLVVGLLVLWARQYDRAVAAELAAEAAERHVKAPGGSYGDAEPWAALMVAPAPCTHPSLRGETARDGTAECAGCGVLIRYYEHGRMLEVPYVIPGPHRD